MKQSLLLLLTITLLTLHAASQTNLLGKWYFFSRNRVIELSITNDSLINRQLDWNLSPRINARNYYAASAIQYVTFANNNHYLKITGSKDDKNGTGVISIRIKKEGKELILLHSEDGMTDAADISHFIQGDTVNHFGMSFISEAEMLRMKALPPVDSMSTADFKRYAASVLEGRKIIDSLFAANDPSNNPLYQAYNMMRRLIGDAGYSPLANEEQLERMYDKFKNDPETKELVSKLLQE